MANDLFIDRAVRDWVFVPLTIFIILMKLIMQYVHVVRPLFLCLPPFPPSQARTAPLRRPLRPALPPPRCDRARASPPFSTHQKTPPPASQNTDDPPKKNHTR